jgi:polyisoprenoid-binding protein YceI
MKKVIVLFIGIFIFISFANAQRYITKNGMIKFYSDSPMEKIEAVNNQVNSALDISTGKLVFKVLMKGFEFKKALMEEHFNENYVESNKYPDATFNGNVINLKEIDLSKPAKDNAVIEGDLKIHGVTKHIKEKGTLEKKDNNIIGKSVFNIKIKDYDIKIPNAVVNNLSETIQITVDVILNKLEK